MLGQCFTDKELARMAAEDEEGGMYHPGFGAPIFEIVNVSAAYEKEPLMSGSDGRYSAVAPSAGAAPTEEDDINPKTRAGMKKPDLSLIPPAALLHESLGMMNGAEKYGPYNWRDKKIPARAYIAAAMRHLQAYLDGEDYSQDTVAAGRPVHHLAHVRCCAGIVLDAMECGKLVDDRPKVKGRAGDMVENFNRTGSTF